ncbi:MAG: LysM peptidoglycan-binding domain-containing protein [Sulfuricaulis sp.]|nr:LysM peptidoglycan-binding domain-containing protein [Sulfuricaulis sp.]
MRKFNILAVLAFLLAGSYAWAQGDIRLAENPPDRYIVQKGDTLWGIAGKFLKEPWRWGEIWRLNKDQIRNPHRIYPGNVIVLDRSRTPPQLTLGPTVRLSPQVRAEPLDTDAVPAIPASAIEPFLTQPLVIEQGGLENAPRIVATEENRVHLGPGSKAYVSGLGQRTETTWQIFRPGRALVDPDSNQTLGIEAIYLGTGRIIRQGEPATMQIVTTTQEISQGDRMVPAGAPVINQYVPRAPATMVKGRIISLYDGLATSEGGKYSIVSVNKGRRDGLELGHVLAVLRTGALIPDPQSSLSRDSAPMIKLPDERYGLVFVFRTFDAVSYALVMDSSRPITSGDVVQSP